jgi:ABC-type transport system substrate-binding protein
MNNRKTISVFLVVLFAAQISFMGIRYVKAQEAENVFIYGTGSGPADLDPQFLWDSASADVIDQVLEPLYANSLDENMTLVPRLAADEGVYDITGTNFTVTLKQGVKFHDGTTMDADDVKFTFDRLANLMTNDIYYPAADVLTPTQVKELYEPFGEDNPIINRTVINSAYNVTFVLNQPYGPFKSLLAFSASYILPEDTTIYPMNRFLDITDSLVGTGPYKYVEFEDGERVIFEAFEDYHGGAPAIKNMIWEVIDDGVVRNQALLTGDIQMVAAPLPEFINSFNTSSDVVLSDGPDRVIIQYLGMSTINIQQEFRDAMSYAFDYEYLYDEIMQGTVGPMTSCIPTGIAYSNGSFDIPYYNVTHARQILIDAGLSGGLDELSTEQDWIDKATTAPLASFNYSYNTDNQVRADVGVMVQNNFEKIGLNITLTGSDWGTFKTALYFHHERLELFWVGWIPDINDPSNFVNILLKAGQLGNGVELNDTELDGWMEAALIETDPLVRQDLYNLIQEKVGEVLHPWIYGYVGKGFDAWSTRLHGYPQNPLAKVWFADCTLDALPPATDLTVWIYVGVAVAVVAIVALVLAKRKQE